MSSLNQVNIIGRLGQDPEVKYTGGGTAVCNLTVATSERWTDKNTGEKKEETEWHRLVVYGKLAEICGEYLRKGSLAFFSGSLKTRKWTDQQSIERYTTEIRVADMKMLGSRDAGGQGGGNQQGAQGGWGQPQQPKGQQQGGAPRTQQQRPQQGAGRNDPPMDFDDDIPF